MLPLTVFLFSWRKSTKVSVNIFSVLQRLCSKTILFIYNFQHWTFRTASIYHVIIKHLEKIIWLETIRTKGKNKDVYVNKECQKWMSSPNWKNWNKIFVFRLHNFDLYLSKKKIGKLGRHKVWNVTDELTCLKCK